ncbi:MAG: phosphoenolpyruvate--protein phosphotransferase [Alphaproteobacteria bacterium]|nr:phosphoenolpyruvate--protein phosphotransferase [Alphaproteobacteria bacterium]
MSRKGKSGVEVQERIIRGIGVSPGVAFGRIALIDAAGYGVPDDPVAEPDIPREVERFDKAVRKSRRQILALKRIRGRLPDAAAAELGDILEAHVHMLGDSRLVRGARKRIQDQCLNAAAAMKAECDAVVMGFQAMDNRYLAARADDVREVAYRVLRNLTDAPKNAFAGAPVGSVVLSESISPADTAMMDPDRINGFAASQGGAQSHTAILARSLGIPAVLGIGTVHPVAADTPVILDGSEGVLVVAPTPETESRYRDKLAKQVREQRRLEALIDEPAATRDGISVRLEANLELPREAEIASRNGADGVGLFRTEFMFMNRDTPPDEEDQYETLAAVVRAMKGRPVTIRTMDVGGEKLAYALGDDLAPSPNPALGLRAIRLSLKRPKLLETQLCAILRAGAHGPVRILLPMIATAGEVRQVRDILARVAKRLRRRGVEFADPLPPLGVMIEVPGAAIAADSLAQVADFFAIGTNDLTQYTLAIDRTDEQVAHLYNPLHPAVLRLMDFAVQAALRARIPVSVCGEIAGDPRFTALLVGLGIRDLSMASTSLLRVKQRIRQIEFTAAANRARMVMESHDSGRIRMLLDDLNGLN